MLRNFIAAFAAEHIKKKGTGLYFVAAIAAAIIPILRLVVKLFLEHEGGRSGLETNYFEAYISDCLMVFTMFFFPMVIIITVSRITQLDHKNGGWQLMETQPVEKFSIYFSKFLVVLIANAIAILSLIGFSLICGAIGLLKGDNAQIATSLPLTFIIQVATRLFVASLFITALQFVIAVLMPSFIWSMLIGFFLYIITGILSAFEYLPDWYPYGILTKVGMSSAGSDLGNWFIYTEYVSLVAAILLLCLGYQWFKYKRFKLAFLGNAKRLITALMVLVLAGGMLFYILKPNLMQPYKYTVVAGKIKGDVPVDHVFIINQMFRDTLMKIPVLNGSFNLKTTTNIVPDHYLIAFGKSYQQQLFFGNKDSVFVDLKLFNNNATYKVTGSRLAENKEQKRSILSWSRVEYYLKENTFIDKPAQFSKSLYQEWNENIKAVSASKTIDNYIPRKDFIARDESLITVKYLNYWETYMEKRKSLMPNEQTIATNDIKKIKKQLSLTDESLLSETSYFDYILAQLIKSDARSINTNVKQLEAILKLPRSSFRDKMLFWQLEKSIKVAEDTEIKALIMGNRANFVDAKFIAIMENKANKESLLKSGMAAPVFEASTLKGKAFTIGELKGKAVVIDVWATWCVPCEEQSDFFERLAIKYNNKGIQFVALSVDQKKESWLIRAKAKSQVVMQLHANNLSKFASDYNMETIPRFVLIDKDGNFVEAKMPYPSEKTFELLLRKTLKLQDE